MSYLKVCEISFQIIFMYCDKLLGNTVVISRYSYNYNCCNLSLLNLNWTERIDIRCMLIIDNSAGFKLL